MKISLSTLFLLAGLLVAGPALADKVYQWTDEEGVTHFGAHPPLGVETKELRPRTGHSEPSDHQTQETAAEPEQREPPSLEGAQVHIPDPQRCASARNNLETLEGPGRILMTDDNGEEYIMSDEDRQLHIEEMRRVIETDC